MNIKQELSIEERLKRLKERQLYTLSKSQELATTKVSPKKRKSRTKPASKNLNLQKQREAHLRISRSFNRYFEETGDHGQVK